MGNKYFALAKNKKKLSKLSKLDKLKIALNIMKTNHSHDRENTRRIKQIARGMIKATHLTLLFILISSFPMSASETVLTVIPSTNSSVFSGSDSKKIPIVNVRIEIENIGGNSELYTEIMPVGSTTSDALAIRHQVTYGKICADPEGVLAVDGIGDYAKGSYWIVSVNGDYVNTNAHTQLKSGDHVKWQHLKKGN